MSQSNISNEEMLANNMHGYLAFLRNTQQLRARTRIGVIRCLNRLANMSLRLMRAGK